MSADLAALPNLPRDTDGPVFREPWEAKAFALALALHQRGVFSWVEWAATLSRQIATDTNAGAVSDGSTYYESWLRALEVLVVGKGVATDQRLSGAADAWARAAAATPHGQPIVLSGEP